MKADLINKIMVEVVIPAEKELSTIFNRYSEISRFDSKKTLRELTKSYQENRSRQILFSSLNRLQEI